MPSDTRRLAVLAVVLLLLTGCGPPGRSQVLPAAPGPASETPTSPATPPPPFLAPPASQPPTPEPPAPATPPPHEPVNPPEPEATAPEMLRSGARGEAVQELQERLAALGLDPGPVDGHFGPATLQAVYALQALHGLARDGVVGPATRAALEQPLAAEPLLPELGPTRVVIDLDRQLLFGYRGGELVLLTHVSSGKASTPTPVGRFTVLRRISGWRTSPLGVLYNPLYFHGGYAVHGAPEVPPHPASHGCVRLPMHVAEYFPSLFADGDPIAIVAG